MIELQDEFAQGVVDTVQASWDEIRIHYENAVVKGHRHVMHTAGYFHQGVRRDLKLPLELLDVLRALKACKPEGQAEEWTWLEFVVSSATGKYNFDYNYGPPPKLTALYGA